MKVADVTAAELQDYEKKLHAASTASADAFEKLARAQNLPTLEHDARKSAIYHAANDTVSTFSDATGKIACDFFDAHVEGAAPSEIAPQPKFIKQRLYEHIEEYEQTHELGDDEFMQLVSQDVYTEVYHHANRTTKHNAIKNKLRYARVPMGNACAFCLMLATRGFDYYTRTSAGEDKGHYHIHCHCKIVAGTKNTKVAGYDPDGLNKRIKQVADSLGVQNFSWKDCMHDSSMRYALQKELQFRDTNWLLTGIPPEVGYENELAEKNARPHEIEQAKRLSQHGIKCIFQVDYEVDEKTKGTARQKIIGKTDLANGIELKSLSNTNSLRKHVEKCLRNARKKVGLTCCHFDGQGTEFTTEEIKKVLEGEMNKLNVKECSFIDSNGEYHKFSRK